MIARIYRWCCPLCRQVTHGNWGQASHQRRHLRDADLQATDWLYLLQHPELVLDEQASIARRFWKFVDKSEGNDACWPWEGRRAEQPFDYGIFTPKKTPVWAHRMAFELTYGTLPKGYQACHSCDNPPCCNPTHLFKGTQAQNIADAKTKGRLARGERCGSATFVIEEVLAIKSLLYHGCSQRCIARLFGVWQTTISEIAHETTWMHVWDTYGSMKDELTHDVYSLALARMTHTVN